MINNIKINNSYFIVFLIIIIISTLYISIKDKNYETMSPHSTKKSLIKRDIIVNKIAVPFLGKILTNNLQNKIYKQDKVDKLSTSIKLLDDPDSKIYIFYNTLMNNLENNYFKIVDNLKNDKSLQGTEFKYFNNDLQILLHYYFFEENNKAEKFLMYIISYVFMNNLYNLLFFNNNSIIKMNKEIIEDKIMSNINNDSTDSYSDEDVNIIIRGIIKKLFNLMIEIYQEIYTSPNSTPNTNIITTFSNVIGKLDNNRKKINKECIKIILIDVVKLIKYYEIKGIRRNSLYFYITLKELFEKFIELNHHLTDNGIHLGNLVFSKNDLQHAYNNLGNEFSDDNYDNKQPQNNNKGLKLHEITLEDAKNLWEELMNSDKSNN